MSFDWSKYESSGGSFISADEKKVLAENGIPFAITAVREVHKFDKLNYELTIQVPNPETGDDEERILSFPIGSGVESRDATLTGLKNALDSGEVEAGDPSLRAKVTKVGRSFIVVPA